MSDLTIRCPCGLYVRATEMQTVQLLEIARAFVTTHKCPELPRENPQ